MHGGGQRNYFRYGMNSPYIYVDPDGNWDWGTLAAAAIGGTIGMVQEGIQNWGQGWTTVGKMLWGNLKGATIAVAAKEAGPWAAAGAAVGFQQIEMIGEGGIESVGTMEFHKNSAITFVTSAASAGIGAGCGYVGSSIGGEAGRAIAGYVGAVASTYLGAAVTGSVNSDNWADLLISSSASYVGGYAAGAVAEGAIQSSGAGSGESKWLSPAEEPDVLWYSPRPPSPFLPKAEGKFGVELEPPREFGKLKLGGPKPKNGAPVPPQN